MIEYKHIIPIVKAQTGQTSRIFGREVRVRTPEEQAYTAQQENQRDLNISKTYFSQVPTIQNLAQGVYYWLKGSEYSPFSRSIDPEEYRVHTGTAPTASKAAARKGIQYASKAAKRSGKRVAEQTSSAKKVADKTTQAARTATDKVNNFWGNRMNWWETSKNSTANKPARYLFNTGRVILGTNIVAPTVVRDIVPGIANNFLENWGFDVRVPTRSNQQQTTQQSDTTQSIQASQYSTLDSLEQAAQKTLQYLRRENGNN